MDRTYPRGFSDSGLGQKPRLATGHKGLSGWKFEVFYGHRHTFSTQNFDIGKSLIDPLIHLIVNTNRERRYQRLRFLIDSELCASVSSSPLHRNEDIQPTSSPLQSTFLDNFFRATFLDND